MNCKRSEKPSSEKEYRKVTALSALKLRAVRIIQKNLRLSYFFPALVLMQQTVLAWGTAFGLAEDVGEVGRGYEAGGFSDVGNTHVGLEKQLFCLFAPDQMMIIQRRHACVALEGPHQVTAVYKQRFGHLFQGEFFFAVCFNVTLSGLGKR